MKILGLITEYNPFHNGHQFHIEESKKLTCADYVIVVMSGSFVQRGTPALIDKYTRTQMALIAGADLVLELPVCYATSSAEHFALGAISLLAHLGIVNCICFGSECGNIDDLMAIAQILTSEPPKFKTTLNTLLKTGITFPSARSSALLSCLTQHHNAEAFRTILNSPNNILGIEYLKALLKLNSSITPYTIARSTTGYHDQTLIEQISSATAIRHSLHENRPLENIRPHVPNPIYELLSCSFLKTFPIFEEDYSLLLQYRLLSSDSDSLDRYLDVTKDLAMRIRNLPFTNCTYQELAMELKTKQFTLTRINRALLHILLNITAKQTDEFNLRGYTQYARILGIRRESSFLIRTIKNTSPFPVITKTAAAKKELSPLALTMLQQDISATHIYNSVVHHKFGTALENEYMHGILLE